MKRLAHLSDLHFGKTEQACVDALVADLNGQHHDLIVISGDLTQRGRRREFEAARNFLTRLPTPTLSVPGNHDIAPFYRPLRRFFAPFKSYQEHISSELCPTYQDDEILVVGVNSVRPRAWKEGAISSGELARLAAALAPAQKFKVVAMHHPPAVPVGLRGRSLSGEQEVLETFRSAGVDVLLTGHLHHGHMWELPVCYVDPTHTVLVSHASTATSTRVRSDPNGYHSVAISGREVRVDRRRFMDGAFSSSLSVVCRKSGKSWRIVDGAGPR